MSRIRKDISGLTYGRLKVIEYSHTTNRRAWWKCLCECGSVKVAEGATLRSGGVRSCGCLLREVSSKRLKGQKHTTTHNLSKTPEYRIWSNIKQRCYNPKLRNYSRYGGRGITMCKEWVESFSRFYKDMGPRPFPSRAYSIDRIDNDGPYSPENCRWATKVEQYNNRSTTVLMEFRGKVQSLAMWERELAMQPGALMARFKRGWDKEKALTTPVKNMGGKGREKII